MRFLNFFSSLYVKIHLKLFFGNLKLGRGSRVYLEKKINIRARKNRSFLNLEPP